MGDLEPLRRRDFTRQCLSGIGAASLLATGTSTAAPPPPAAPEESREEPPVPPAPEVLLLTTLMQQYPSENYTEEALQSIYGDIAGDLARDRQLRAFPLTHGDHPAVVFRVFRAMPAVEGAP